MNQGLNTGPGLNILRSANCSPLESAASAQYVSAALDWAGKQDNWPLGWLDSAAAIQTAQDSSLLAAELKKSANRMVVVGIGGSALPAKAIHSALHFGEMRFGSLAFLDNADASLYASEMYSRNPGETAVCIVSKSGSTLEALTIARKLAAEFPGAKYLVCTEDKPSKLSELAYEHDWPLVSMPDNIGGRFSAFTAGALLPLAFSGIDPGHLTGAAFPAEQHFENACKLASNLLTLQANGQQTLVIYTYSEKLMQFAYWLQQMWAESLGKAATIDGSKISPLMLPMVARGSTDQHSLNQHFLESSQDTAFFFLSDGTEQTDALSRLQSASLHGTYKALEEQGKPVLHAALEAGNAAALGAAMMQVMLTTTACGYALNVNPFDQPRVERSKEITRQLLNTPEES